MADGSALPPVSRPENYREALQRIADLPNWPVHMGDEMQRIARAALRAGPPPDGWAEHWQQQAAEWKRRALAAEGKRYCSEAGPPGAIRE